MISAMLCLIAATSGAPFYAVALAEDLAEALHESPGARWGGDFCDHVGGRHDRPARHAAVFFSM